MYTIPCTVSFIAFTRSSHDHRFLHCLTSIDHKILISKNYSRTYYISPLQQDLDQLYIWSIDSDLFFGISKCIYLSFNNKTPTSYSLDGNTLPRLHSHRDLGIQISDNLSWENHYKHITSKAYRYLGLLRRAFSNCHSVKAKKTLYITLVRSQLTYCSQLWNPYLIKDTITLEKIQRQATKFILKDYESSYHTLLKLDLLPLMYTLDFYDIMFFIKALKQPSNHFNIYDHVSFSTENTRSSSNNKLNHVYTLLTITPGTSISTEYQDCGINYHPSI